MADALAYLRVAPDDDPWAARRDELKAQAEKDAAKRASKGRAKHKPERDDVIDAPTLLVTSPGQIPDLRGKTAREAVAGLVARGYRSRIDGSGVVVRQTPSAGTVLSEGQTCTLHLGEFAQVLEDERRARSESKSPAPVLVAARSAAATPRISRRRR